MGATEWVALVLSVLWLAGAAGFFLVIPAGAAPLARPLFLMTLLAVFMPVAIFWMAAAVARSARVMREESERLQAAIDAMRRTYLRDARRGEQSEAAERRMVQIASRAESAVAGLATRAPPRALAAPPPSPEDRPHAQRNLPLGEADGPEALTKSDVIRALDFPQDENDAEGFDALRRALASPKLRRLVQASQAVLTDLSEDGIYVDDLTPRVTLPEDWRAFAGGRRGKAIERLGAIRDRSSLALARGRMRSDSDFRERALRFLRLFDTAYADFEHGATDEEIAQMARTRTTRAFMLLGRLAGLFD